MSTTFAEALGAQLVDAAAREPARRRRRRQRGFAALATVLVVVGATVVVVVAHDPAPAAAGLEVARHEGRVSFLLVDLEHLSPAVIERDARAADVDVDVREVPSGPSARHRFVGDAVIRPSPGSVQLIDESAGTFRGFDVTEGWTGRLMLFLGRAAKPGERYYQPTVANAPGEPLACVVVAGSSPAALRQEATKRQLQVRWQFAGVGTARFVPYEEVPSDAVVLRATANSATDVVVTVAPKGAELSPNDRRNPGDC